MARRFEVDTPTGPAGVDLDLPRSPGGLLVLGHGAGGGVDASDLLAIRDAVRAVGVAVARVTQPYRMAGRHAPAPAAQLDAGWLAVVGSLRRRSGLWDVPLIVGGRSSGARVACRTAAAAGACAVVALAFPVHPPGRPERSRLDELTQLRLPLLVVQGDRDAFGRPPATVFAPPERRLAVVPGADHSLKRDPAAVARAVVGFLSEAGLVRGR